MARIHIWLLSGALATLGLAAVCPDGESDVGSCIATSTSDSNADGTPQSTFLLQTDVIVHKRGKKGSSKVHNVQIQGDGIVNPVKREALDEAARLVKLEQESIPTIKPYTKIKDAAAAAGVTTNAEGDGTAFVTALFTNVFMCFACMGVFMVLRPRYPLTYSNNLKTNTAPLDCIPEGSFGWATASWHTTTASVMQNAGLDQAMLLEFSNLGMRIMAMVGIPMFCIMGPANCFLGGHAAGTDHLSYFSFGNVMDGSPLYWIHALVVWGVVAIVQTSVYAAQKNFCGYRYQWLREMPNPRANTVLVEGIPDTYQSDAELKAFFAKMFGANKVQSAYVVRTFPALEAAWNARGASQAYLAKAQATGNHDEVASLEEAMQGLDRELETNQAEAKLKKDHRGSEGFHTSTGFVSFSDKSHMAFALSTQLGEDADEWEISSPPGPSSVLWKDLQGSGASKGGFTILGYALTIALFMLYIPLVVGITQIAEKIKMGPFQPLWAGFAPTLGLLAMISFLPTILILIFRFCFTLKDDAWAQQVLQNWYFLFQVVFVLLVTAIGGSMTEFLHALVYEPMSIFPMLAKTMPFATHFYMNYLLLQWTTHAMEFTRHTPLLKWRLAVAAGYDEQAALELAEPEDQDYYGIGARSARWTINLCIGIIYGTLCPPMTVLCFIEFFICRLVYGYMIPFAETKKADLGGEFWVQQLRHVFVGNIIFVIVMIGVLMGRATTNGPAMIAAPSLLYVIWSMKKFERVFSWEKLPFAELMVEGECKHKQKKDEGDYVQPWMKAVLDDKAIAPAAKKTWMF